MQLAIPIEDTSGGSGARNHCIEQPRERETGTRNRTAEAAVDRNDSNNANDDAILSGDLRDQFEAMKSVWRQARRGSEDAASSSFNDSSETRERREIVRADLKRKERETAVETAIKVANEIATWQDGIADLEALLAAAEEEEELPIEEETDEGDEVVRENGPPGVREIEFVARHAPPRPAQVRFPFLPPAIPTDEEEDDAASSASSSSNV